ncbi:MAG: ATP-binding protein [Methanospirillum sp.]|nr:ATP-binding protein [Methanospirillum sp.]
MSWLILARENELMRLNQDQDEIVARRTAELQQVRDAFEQANIKLKMLTGITHSDILKQVSALSGSLDLALEETGSGTMAERIRGCRSIVLTIQNQILFTKVYEEIGTASPIWHPLRETTEQAIRELPETGISFRLAPDDIRILAYPLLGKVFYTLIENMIPHGKHATQAGVSYSVQDNDLIIVYEDNGTGIDDDQKSGIFTEGFEKNSGFGLFIAREILAVTHLASGRWESSEKGYGSRSAFLTGTGDERDEESMHPDHGKNISWRIVTGLFPGSDHEHRYRDIPHPLSSLQGFHSGGISFLCFISEE